MLLFFSLLLALLILFLKVHECVEDHSKDQVQDEKVSYDDNRKAIDDSKGGIINIHQIVHHLTPIIS
jgi:hypothetical protein